MQYLKSYQKKKNKNSASSPLIFFFGLKNETEKQQGHTYGKGNDIYSQYIR
jgi:hypothetical protein